LAPQAPRRVDCYVPKVYDSYVPNYDRSGKRVQTRSDRDWSDPDPPSVPKDLIEFRPLDKEYLDAVNQEQSSGPAPLVPAITITQSSDT
jgi:hypothetical protein